MLRKVRGVIYWQTGDGRTIPVRQLSNEHLESTLQVLRHEASSRRIPDANRDQQMLEALAMLNKEYLYRQKRGVVVKELGNPYYNKANLARIDPLDKKAQIMRVVQLIDQNERALAMMVVDELSNRW